MQASTTGSRSALEAKTLGEIVAEDFRSARVFEGHGMDFCCGGKVALGEACREKGLDAAQVLAELEAARAAPVERGQNYAAWALPFLADYIVNTHHAWLGENTGQILAYARKIASVHGPNHPELIEIAAIFARIASDMAGHLKEEEEVLFPALRRLDAAAKAGAKPAAADKAAIEASLKVLDRDHDEIGDAVHEIRRLSGGYSLPVDACTTFALAYGKLREFEEDLHKHVHLENNILFPRAAAL